MQGWVGSHGLGERAPSAVQASPAAGQEAGRGPPSGRRSSGIHQRAAPCRRARSRPPAAARRRTLPAQGPTRAMLVLQPRQRPGLLRSYRSCGARPCCRGLPSSRQGGVRTWMRPMKSCWSTPASRVPANSCATWKQQWKVAALARHRQAGRQAGDECWLGERPPAPTAAATALHACLPVPHRIVPLPQRKVVHEEVFGVQQRHGCNVAPAGRAAADGGGAAAASGGPAPVVAPGVGRAH